MAAARNAFQPDAVSPLRISAWSLALAFHAAALGLLLMPASALISPLPLLETPPILAEIIPRDLAPPPPAPPIPQPPQRPRDVPRTPVPQTVPVQLEATPMSIPAVETSSQIDAAESAIDFTPPVSRGAQIAYEHAPPPPYPRNALKRHMEGTVLLIVHVDETGRPREVRVEESSGHALLDRTASDHVLARWRFQPALQDGIAVSAWARVPVSFRMQNG